MFASKAAQKRLKYQMLIVALALPGGVIAAPHSGDSHASVADQVIQAQQDALGKNTAGKGYGPQSPRDIDALFGRNLVSFGTAPKSSEMNLCNIHFHKMPNTKADNSQSLLETEMDTAMVPATNMSVS